MTSWGDSGDKPYEPTSSGAYEPPPIEESQGQPNYDVGAAPPGGGYGYSPPSYPPPSYPPPSYPPQGYPQASGYPPPSYSGPSGYAPQPQYVPPAQPYSAAGYGAYPAGGPSQPGSGTNGLAIGSLVASVVGVPLGLFCFVGLLGSIAGIVLGIVAMNQIKTSHQEGKGLAIAGIAVGAGTLVVFVILLIIGISIGST